MDGTPATIAMPGSVSESSNAGHGWDFWISGVSNKWKFELYQADKDWYANIWKRSMESDQKYVFSSEPGDLTLTNCPAAVIWEFSYIR
jgi:hypothetical protein